MIMLFQEAKESSVYLYSPNLYWEMPLNFFGIKHSL